MVISLMRACNEDKTVVQNLMQFYLYDFSEYITYDVGHNGLFAAYPYFDEYWNNDSTRICYLIKHQDKISGFVFVKKIELTDSNHYSIAEFFVLKKYRRQGIGKEIAFQIFNIHKGRWEIFQRESNKPSHAFWKNVIDGYTRGNFRERFEDGKWIQSFTSDEQRL